MPLIKEKNSVNNFENFLFRFESCSCNCVEDIEHTSPGKDPTIRLKLQAIPEKLLRFGYTTKGGLFRIASNVSTEDRNILGKLISLSNKPTKELFSFFKSNGFLFPVSETSYTGFDEKVLYEIINRLKITVELMTAVSEIRKNYKKICELVISLLLHKDISINTDFMNKPYSSCHNSYLETINNSPSELSPKRKQEKFDGNAYTIADSLYGKYNLSINDYNDIIGGYRSVPGFQNELYIKVTMMFVNYEKQDTAKKISDFLFHFFYDMNGDSSNNFPEVMKVAVIEIAKFLIKEEINYNIKDIHPVYDSETMTPSWKVDSLLSAVYFSIFYLKPDLELYRPCDNPRCGRYFLVNTTSTRKRFCSKECCNRVTQDRYRKRKREKEQI